MQEGEMPCRFLGVKACKGFVKGGFWVAADFNSPPGTHSATSPSAA